MSEPMHVVQFRLTVKEYRLVQDQAGWMGDSVPAFCRALALSASRRGALLGPTGAPGDSHPDAPVLNGNEHLAIAQNDLVVRGEVEDLQAPQVPDLVPDPELEGVLIEKTPTVGADQIRGLHREWVKPIPKNSGKRTKP